MVTAQNMYFGVLIVTHDVTSCIIRYFTDVSMEYIGTIFRIKKDEQETDKIQAASVPQTARRHIPEGSILHLFMVSDESERIWKEAFVA
jgi:hypothetical protein